jgi:hypothetical protein
MHCPSLLAVLPVILSLVTAAVSHLLAAGGALAAQEVSPSATPVASAPPVETLVTTTFPADIIPTTTSRSFLIWHATIAPGTEVAIPAELVACCPGPQIEHVVSGELTLRVEGPLQVVRAAANGTPVPIEEVAPGTEVVLRAGDTALYALELPVKYDNSGTAPVHLVASGLFAGSPPTPPADYAIDSFQERYPAPPLPPGSLVVTLQQATLAPEEVFPAPPSGAEQVIMTRPALGTLGERSDGSVQNLGWEPVDVYAVVLRPEAAAGGTPAAS